MEMSPDSRRCGVAAAVVEQELIIAPKIAEQVMVMGHGEIVFRVAPGEAAHAAIIVRNDAHKGSDRPDLPAG